MMTIAVFRRRQAIWRDITACPTLTRRALARRYGVGLTTIFKDLEYLRAQGYVDWYYGCHGVTCLVPCIDQ